MSGELTACCTNPDEQAKRDLWHRVSTALRSLRYSGNVLATLPYPHWDLSEQDYIDDLCQWLQEYSKVLVAASETSTEMARELAELRGQRKAVRDFLGLPSPTGEA